MDKEEGEDQTLAVAILTDKRGSVSLEQLLFGLQFERLVHEPVEKRVLGTLVASHRLVLRSAVHRVPQNELTGKIRKKRTKKKKKMLTSSSSSPSISKQIFFFG
jgi:hypothetical protein